MAKKPEGGRIRNFSSPIDENDLQIDEALLDRLDALDSHAPAAFFEAARFGVTRDLVRHIEDGVNVNARDPRTKGTALHHVAASNARDALEVLLGSGKIDSLLRDRFGRLAFELSDDPFIADRLLNLHVEQAKARGIRLRFRG